MFERKLASIQIISKINTLFDKENKPADNIVQVEFQKIGWKCVAGKDNFKVGDKCVYFEIDSFLPELESLEFLRNSSFRIMFTGERGFRLKTAKFLGNVSQGLALPLSFFDLDPSIEEETNVSEILNIKKYERKPEISMQGDLIADYPGHTPKTGAIRIQNALEFFELYKNVVFERTLKLDGTSVSYHCLNQEVQASSHNSVFAHNNKFSPWEFADKIGLEEALIKLNKNITIQGEFIGPKIQTNREGLKEKTFRVFNIWNINESRYLTMKERLSLLAELNLLLKEPLEHVEIIELVKVFEVHKDIDSLLASAEGLNENGQEREGDVYKSEEPVNGEIICFKVISNKYLLKEKD